MRQRDAGDTGDGEGFLLMIFEDKPAGARIVGARIGRGR